MRARPARLVPIPGGRVAVGTRTPALPDDGEGPPRPAQVRSFLIDPFAVTNADFAAFVTATGYVSEAQRLGWSAVFIGLLPTERRQGRTSASASWWERMDGASWSAPEGPGSSIAGREHHPVVHVAHADALAFAAFAGGRLPSEAEWEHAARGRLDDPRFPWGDREPDDETFQPANLWQGSFPTANTAADGFVGTAPVDAFPPNGYGLHNMCGNVWEWTAEPFRVASLRKAARARDLAARKAGDRLIKGGSFLCHRSYCYRYRIAARSGVPPDTAASHLGFRLVFDL